MWADWCRELVLYFKSISGMLIHVFIMAVSWSKPGQPAPKPWQLHILIILVVRVCLLMCLDICPCYAIQRTQLYCKINCISDFFYALRGLQCGFQLYSKSPLPISEGFWPIQNRLGKNDGKIWLAFIYELNPLTCNTFHQGTKSAVSFIPKTTAIAKYCFHITPSDLKWAIAWSTGW